MSNFNYLKNNKDFDSFSTTAINAEKQLIIDLDSSAINCRRALEFAIKYMYSVDRDLILPFDDSLASLMSTEEFRDIVQQDILDRIHLIRKVGNIAVHSSNKLKKEQVELCIENLFIFLDFIAYVYDSNYEEHIYNKNILLDKEISKDVETNISLKELKEENQKLNKELSNLRSLRIDTYIPKPLDISEFQTRKIYIDTTLIDCGWKEGNDWINELEVFGMPNVSGKGFVDYVLYDERHVPLAIIEAKKTCKDVAEGRHQASLYADILEKQYKRRPIIFLTNGFDTRIIDGKYQERIVSNIYSKKDLKKLFNLRKEQTKLNDIRIDKNIVDRYYQEGAIKAVCENFSIKNRRTSLLVMATGSGKTRTAIGLIDVLLKNGWIKNILFLADRTSLVKQAKSNFSKILPNLSVSNICEKNPDYTANCIFSTYPTLMNAIDNAKNENSKLYTSGHFDLIVCDEAHRSIYNKYSDIFTYFDSLLLGLTATPKDEIDRNTYNFFKLENDNPTYAYELSQGVNDKFLVDYISIETELNYITNGIVFDDLDEEEQEEFGDTFTNEDGDVPKRISSSAINKWVFNEDTIKKALRILMDNGLKIEHQTKVGKTIIFAKNHLHAEKILEVFNSEYPHLVGFAQVIDNHINYADDLIDKFSDAKQLPQIAISVDMLDTGVDVPEILNLMFFKPVMSKTKFWQMIGRGTRLCPFLIDGVNKEKFYIFDFCGNFEYFRFNKGSSSETKMSLQGSLIDLKAQIALKLQEHHYQTEDLIKYRDDLVFDILMKAQELDETKFNVKQHLKYVKMFKEEKTYEALTYEETQLLKTHISPLIYPYNDEINALRFDALIYGIVLGNLASSNVSKGKRDLLNKVTNVSKISNVPEIKVQYTFIDKLLNTDFVDRAGIIEYDEIRNKIRNLIKYIPKVNLIYDTNFTDDVISSTWNESELETTGLGNYKAKAQAYISENINNSIIQKIKKNIALDESDIETLEEIFWKQIGTKESYANELGEKSIGQFIREFVGMDMNSAKEAFAKFLEFNSLTSSQIYFLNQIIEYIVINGVLYDLSVLQSSPFTDKGSVVEVFDDISLFTQIKQVIASINSNSITK